MNVRRCIDLTRMECKVKDTRVTTSLDLCIDLTRMECKVFSFGSIFIGLLVYRFNQNGM